MPIDNEITSLRAKFQPIAYAWLDIVSERIIPVRFPDFKVRITETLRTPDRQLEVHASGKSDVKIGYHNVGLAFDFAVIDDDGIYIEDGTHPAYTVFGTVGESLGCFWGGRWRKPDWDHLEYHPGFTLEQFLAADKAGRDLTA